MHIATTLCIGEPISFYGDSKIKCREIVHCIKEKFTRLATFKARGNFFVSVGFLLTFISYF